MFGLTHYTTNASTTTSLYFIPCEVLSVGIIIYNLKSMSYDFSKTKLE